MASQLGNRRGMRSSRRSPPVARDVKVRRGLCAPSSTNALGDDNVGGGPRVGLQPKGPYRGGGTGQAQAHTVAPAQRRPSPRKSARGDTTWAPSRCGLHVHLYDELSVLDGGRRQHCYEVLTIRAPLLRHLLRGGSSFAHVAVAGEPAHLLAEPAAEGHDRVRRLSGAARADGELLH